MKNITLVGIDGLGTETKIYENLLNNIKLNFNCLNINEILFFTSNKEYLNKDFNTVKLIKPLDYTDLNVLMMQHISNFSDGNYFMIVQPDGQPKNNNLWNSEFLDYDYIGAPWPAGMRWTGNKAIVGNGGFSIRSRKLYELTKFIQGYENYHRQTITNEDVMISVVLKDFLEKNKIKFAPVEIARKFSIEIPIDDDHKIETTFGFHGKKYLSN